MSFHKFYISFCLLLCNANFFPCSPFSEILMAFREDFSCLIKFLSISSDSLGNYFLPNKKKKEKERDSSHKSLWLLKAIKAKSFPFSSAYLRGCFNNVKIDDKKLTWILVSLKRRDSHNLGKIVQWGHTQILMRHSIRIWQMTSGRFEKEPRKHDDRPHKVQAFFWINPINAIIVDVAGMCDTIILTNYGASHTCSAKVLSSVHINE